MVNLKANLLSLCLADDNFEESETITIKYTGSAKNDGSLLTPDHVCYMLEQVSSEALTITKAHREIILLTDHITQ